MPTQLRWIRPDVEQMMWFRELRFGKAVSEPHYRPAPYEHRVSAYRDPFYFYFFDPYYGLLQWLLVDALTRDRYGGPEVIVVNSTREFLFDKRDAKRANAAWLGLDAVRTTAGGLGLSLGNWIPDPKEVLPSALAQSYRADFVEDTVDKQDPAQWNVHDDDAQFVGFDGVGYSL
jgi:hypothetical protein